MNNDLFEVNQILESTERTLTRVGTTFAGIKFESRLDEQTRKRIESISPGKKKNDALSELANLIRGQQPGSSIKRAVDIALSTDVELPIYEWLKKICEHAERLVSTEEEMIADGLVTEWEAENSDARVVGEYLYDITDSWKHYNEVMNGRNAGTKEDETEADRKKPGTMKVTTDVLYEILKKAGINGSTADKTVISNLISYLTGYSSEQIRQRLSNTEELTSRHKNEVDKVNEILNKLNTNISIKYNNNR